MLLGGDLGLTIFLLINMFVLGVVVTLLVTHFRRYRPHKAADETISLLPEQARERVAENVESCYERVLRRSALTFHKELEATTVRLNEQLNRVAEGIMRSEMTRYQASLAALREESQKKIGSASAEIDTHQQELRAKIAAREAKTDEQIATYRQELGRRLSDYTAKLEREFADIKDEYARKQAELDASLKSRETTIAEQQSVQQAELVDRQRQLTAKQVELETRLETEFAKRREAYAAQLETKLGDTVTAFLTDTLGQQADLGAQMPYLLGQLEAHKADLIREVKGDV